MEKYSGDFGDTKEGFVGESVGEGREEYNAETDLLCCSEYSITLEISDSSFDFNDFNSSLLSLFLVP